MIAAVVGVEALSMSGDSKDSNVIPFPGATTDTPNQCQTDERCAKRQAQLEAWRAFTAKDYPMVATGDGNYASRARNYNKVASVYNEQAEAHNAMCPNHQVEYLPLAPIGPRSIP
jgi:hypothetical protein